MNPQSSLNREDLTELSKAVDECTQRTKDFLLPMLGFPPVHHVLYSFLHHGDKSFEDWVWDPTIRDVLERFREQYAGQQCTSSGVEMNQVYEKVQQKVLEDPVIHNDWLQNLFQQKELAKTKFTSGNYYAARRQYETILLALDEAKLEVDESPTSVYHFAQALNVSCCANIAVTGLKEQDSACVLTYAQRVLAIDPEHVKGLWLESKGLMMEHRYEEVYTKLELLVSKFPDQKDFSKLLKEARAREVAVNARTPAAPLTQISPFDDMTKKFTLPRPNLPWLSICGALSNYCLKIKIWFEPYYEQRHDEGDDANSEYECKYMYFDRTLAHGVGKSKKQAQHRAAKNTIIWLWNAAKEKNLLTEEDKLALETTENFFDLEQEELEEVEGHVVPLSELEPIFVETFQRRKNPSAILNEWQDKNPLTIEFNYEDLTTYKPCVRSFKCEVVANGQVVGTAVERNKKTAKNAASALAIEEITRLTTPANE